MLSAHSYQIGDRVVVRVCKRSTHPGPRAQHVRPEPCGDGYRYEVDKFWAVADVRGEQLVLQTRRGKVRIMPIDDPAIRPAGWWQKLIYRDRFPDANADTGGMPVH